MSTPFLAVLAIATVAALSVVIFHAVSAIVTMDMLLQNVVNAYHNGADEDLQQVVLQIESYLEDEDDPYTN